MKTNIYYFNTKMGSGAANFWVFGST